VSLSADYGQSSYERFRKRVRLSDDPWRLWLESAIGDTRPALSWELGSIGHWDWDATPATAEARRLWANKEFRRLVRYLPLLLVDPKWPGAALFNGAGGRVLRIHLAEVVLAAMPRGAREGWQRLSRLLLRRLLFYDCWQVWEGQRSRTPRRREEREQRALAAERCRLALGAWVAALGRQGSATLFEDGARRYEALYPATLEQIRQLCPRPELLAPPKGADRESEMTLALLDNSARPAELRLAEDEQDLRFVDNLLRFWFLRRYDLGAADRLLDGVCRAECTLRGQAAARVAEEAAREGKNGLSRQRQRLRMLRQRAASRLRLILSPASTGWRAAPAVIMAVLTWGSLIAALLGGLDSSGWAPGLQAFLAWCANASGCLFELFLGYGVLWGLLLVCQFVGWGERAIYLHVPRLAAATLVGLAGLLNIGGFGELALSLGAVGGHTRVALLVVASLAVALLYLQWEAGTPHLSRRRRLWRSVRLLLLGLTQAVALAALFSWILAEPVLIAGARVPPDVDPVRLGGILAAYGLGNYYPTVAALLAPCSLAIGVILQILWQEQPMTDVGVAK